MAPFFSYFTRVMTSLRVVASLSTCACAVTHYFCLYCRKWCVRVRHTLSTGVEPVSLRLALGRGFPFGTRRECILVSRKSGCCPQDIAFQTRFDACAPAVCYLTRKPHRTRGNGRLLSARWPNRAVLPFSAPLLRPSLAERVRGVRVDL